MADFINDDSTQTTSVFSQGNAFTSKTNPNVRLSYTAGIYYDIIIRALITLEYIQIQ